MLNIILIFISHMHSEVLTNKQVELLPLIKSFSNEFGLVGGTAIALQLGHRKSLDFDLFKTTAFDILKLKRKINSYFPIEQIKVENIDEYTLTVNDIQLTFYHYPYQLDYVVKFDDITNLPNLQTLAAMKAFALGKRAKWKDYVDLYFIFQKYTLAEVVARATQIFKGEFNEKLFREQLSYHEDINYTEKVVYMPSFEVNDENIKKRLIEISLV
ncbi:nucleotidyl transferase AbiEii/AbiGii toxin family protein [Patescibacteria group bacterium]|nr:nucleotidyl transferase AbiEii/AbiGii toxin family protein [Patescibacteria group bacterium]